MEIDVKIIVAIIAAVSALVSAYVVHALSRKKEAAKTDVEIAKEFAALKSSSPSDAEALANCLGPGLLVYNREGGKFIIDLPPSGTLIVGRSASTDIQIDDQGVSGETAMISVREGEVTIQSLVTVNNIEINGMFISKHKLAADDCIRIGNTQIYYREK